MISGSDISEMITDSVVEPVLENVDIGRRAEEAARQLVNETYAANVVTETMLSVRMLSWNDLPTAAISWLTYPADLARAQLYGWSAWLNYLEKQYALLCAHTGVKGWAEAARDRPEIAGKTDRQTAPAKANSSSRRRYARRGSAKDPNHPPSAPLP